jgi:hypothetical protein
VLEIFEHGNIFKREFRLKQMFVFRFENMKKEQEEEAARRVAEERSKRATHDQQSSSNGNGNGYTKPKQQEAPPVVSSPPPSIPRPETPPSAPVQVSHSSIYQNVANQFANHPTSPSVETKEETNRFVSGVNVSSLLRQRKASSSSSKNEEEEEEDEWAQDHHSFNQYQPPQHQSPSPTPATGQSSNEGIKCIARYSYQKSKSLSIESFRSSFLFSGR